MYGWSQWWGRYRVPLILISLALGGAWFFRQTQGSLILELYQQISRPWQGNISKVQLLTNAKIEELEARLKEVETQNQQLRKLINYSKTSKFPGIITPVVGRSADNWWHQLTLARGEKDGIRVGDTVMAPGGLIGRVVTTSASSSRVLLISDRSSRVGVAVGRSRNMGFLRGQEGDRAVVEFFDKVPNVRPGDLIVTSTVSQLFPAGLPIGRVESINLQKDPAPEALIKLNAPIGYLEWVVVHRRK
ncbi:rod shape-determining protein MreC [Merismopedia glauca]|uniref:Cell shape-determining protein MreC n=2 Tax=Merismopedia TaxID=53402 RepID=A0A2T1C3L7_9CYAN|nr:rod shape-determining protein MreC [Merismopedia glauca]PSB02849.1 rod shape-determining protein MreC [Merismopedia glauca CCAP 1448/3]